MRRTLTGLLSTIIAITTLSSCAATSDTVETDVSELTDTSVTTTTVQTTTTEASSAEVTTTETIETKPELCSPEAKNAYNSIVNMLTEWKYNGVNNASLIDIDFDNTPELIIDLSDKFACYRFLDDYNTIEYIDELPTKSFYISLYTDENGDKSWYSYSNVYEFDPQGLLKSQGIDSYLRTDYFLFKLQNGEFTKDVMYSEELIHYENEDQCQNYYCGDELFSQDYMTAAEFEALDGAPDTPGFHKWLDKKTAWETPLNDTTYRLDSTYCDDLWWNNSSEDEINSSVAEMVNAYFSGDESFFKYSTTYGTDYEKPVIYLYPEEETDISVKLVFDGNLTCTYPEYNNGWNVTAYPDGTIINDDGREYSYLYWEGVSDADWDMSAGFVVRGSDTAEFLQQKLEYLGLTPKEYNEFIVYWLPLMKDNKFNLITFQTDAYEDITHLDISPSPDSMQRIFMVYKPLDEYIDIPEQQLVPFERSGYTVIEWGGSCKD